LGQALRLDDEPTLVRAVKAVKRSMERDERVRERFMSLAISTFANICMGIGRYIQRTRTGLSIGLLATGIGRLLSSRLRWTIILESMVLSTLGGVLVLPSSVTPYALDSPVITLLLKHVGTASLLVTLTHDITNLITLKLERRAKQKRDEIARQEKMRGIFYTPVKPKSAATRSVSFRGGGGAAIRGIGNSGMGNGKGELGSSGHSKPRSMFT
jgi:hypothetical protein